MCIAAFHIFYKDHVLTLYTIEPIQHPIPPKKRNKEEDNASRVLYNDSEVS